MALLQPPRRRGLATNENLPQVEVLRGCLMHLMDYFESYHHSKENMSWLAATIYLAGLAALASIHFTYNNNVVRVVMCIALTLFVVITGSLIFVFIRQQRSDRRLAARFVGATGDLLTDLLTQDTVLTWADLHVEQYAADGSPRPVPAILLRYLTSPARQGRRWDWYILSPVFVIILWTAGALLFVWLRTFSIV